MVEHRDRQGHTISKGQLINNRFVVDRKLGEGGFGEVFLVHDRSTDQICALKLLRPELAAHGALQENFRAEAAIWMGFERHPNIVSVRSVDLFNGCLFIALEFVPAGEIGDNCLDKVLRRRTISVPTTTRWGIELCDALIHAGSKGMIAHRDLKPSNLMIDPGGQLKLTDFGLALSVLSPASRGKEASPSGTLPYMPPEQFRPVAVIDQRSDVYSFGLVLFEICAGGHLPFQIGQPDPRNLVEYFYRLHSTYELPGLDTPLYPVIARCLRKAPSQRYQSFGEVRRDLLVLFQQVTGTGFVPVSKEQMNASEHNNYAVSYDMIGDVKRAMKHIDLAIQAAPHYSPSHNNKAAFLAAQGRVEEALAIWNKLTAEHPELGRPFYNLGNNSMRLGRLSEAVSLFREAMKREPDWVPAIVNTAIAYQQMRDGPSAIEFYNRAIALSPGEAQIRYNYGFCLYELGDYNGALSMLTQAAELNPHHLSTLNYLGLCHMELSMFREAVACFDRAIRIDPQYKHALDNRSRVLNVIGHKKGLLGRLFGKR